MGKIQATHAHICAPRKQTWCIPAFMTIDKNAGQCHPPPAMQSGHSTESQMPSAIRHIRRNATALHWGHAVSKKRLGYPKSNVATAAVAASGPLKHASPWQLPARSSASIYAAERYGNMHKKSCPHTTQCCSIADGLSSWPRVAHEACCRNCLLSFWHGLCLCGTPRNILG